MADAKNTVKRARVGGSGFTVFTWDGKLIGFARQISHTSPQPVAPATPIHPLNSPYPRHIITPQAAGMGTLTLDLYELYGRQAWDQLKGLTGSNDIVEIFAKVANSDHAINMVKYIKPPKLRGKTMKAYYEQYHDCVITNVIDGETINIATMEVLKQITVAYRYMSRNGRNDFTKRSGVPGSTDAGFSNGKLEFS
jgi:hypothetical protein